MKLHNILENEDCIGRKITADIPVGLAWVDYQEDFTGGVITPDGVEAHIPNTDYRDVYVEDGLLGYCQGEVCEIKAYNEETETVTLLNNDPNRSLAASGDNATEFTIPYERYAACFGTGWPYEEFTLKSARETEKPSVIDAIRADRQKPRRPEAKPKKAKNRTNNEREK